MSQYFLPSDLISGADLDLPSAGVAAFPLGKLSILERAVGSGTVSNDALSDGLEGFADADLPCGTLLSVAGVESRDRKRKQRRRKATARARGDPDNGEDLQCNGSNSVQSSIAYAVAPTYGTSTVACTSEEELAPFLASRWHSSALSAGNLSEDGHVFAKKHAGPRKNHSNGMTLSSLCMLFERNLRVGGVHQYRYAILEGSVGAADGVGFVFDSRIRRTNIQRMRSVFLNKHGQVCMRNLENIVKLPCSLPKLSEGVSVYITVDLDRAAARFKMDDPGGKHCGTADLSFASLLSDTMTSSQQSSSTTLCSVRSGFFCAIVTGSITVSLH